MSSFCSAVGIGMSALQDSEPVLLDLEALSGRDDRGRVGGLDDRRALDLVPGPKRLELEDRGLDPGVLEVRLACAGRLRLFAGRLQLGERELLAGHGDA